MAAGDEVSTGPTMNEEFAPDLADDAARARPSMSQIVELAPTAMLVVEPGNSIVLVNEAVERMFGYDRSELLGRNIEILAPVRLRGGHGACAQFFGAEETSVESRGQRKDGSEFPLEVMLTPLEAASGTVMLCSVIDISERRQAEETLRRSEKLFATAFQASPNMVTLTALEDGKYLDVNDAFLRICGRRREEVLGRTSSDLGFWDDPALRGKMVETLHRDGLVRGMEAKVRTGAGEVRDFIYSVDVIRVEDRDLLLGIGHDVTELRATEARLRQALRVEAIGQLTGGVAHDFNNLLAIILGNLELIDEATAEDAPTKVLIQDALKAGQRGAGLTHQLLAYSRQQPLAPQIVAIGKLVLESSMLLSRTLGATITIEHDIPDNLWLARIDPGQLENALLNLAVNARDAMPGGGRLLIEASNTILDRDYADHNVEVEPGPYVLVAITDTGTGMSEQVIARALEPFFTTKRTGEGSGLGLSMVYGFVKQSGGHLKIYSELDHGTTVRLYLPKADRDTVDLADYREPAALSVGIGSEVVLVVEDDPMVRALAVRMLSGLGYCTLDAADGPAALAILEDAMHIDLLLTDVVLPRGMSGPQLVSAALVRRPRLKVVYMSGYTRNSIIHNGVLDAGVELLTKPFSRQDLASRVRRRLDGGRAG
jgi:PAS domain S-box-containing protein